MNTCPILSALQNGDQFPYQLLKNEVEAIEAFWDWWWENKFDGTLERPKTIIDDDPLLIPTRNKEFVDTASDDHFFCQPLRCYLSRNRLPRDVAVPREEFRKIIVQSQLSAIRPKSEKTILFTGGGYGAGKTESVQFLAPLHGFQTEEVFGVDYFKQLLPEYSLVKSMADGRASEICQTECRDIADTFFQEAVDAGKSFGWDNSMSNYDQTVAKIQYALSKGYRLDLISVLTQTPVAIQRAMKRALETGRFAPPLYLVSSHKQFCENLTKYVPFFDRVWIFENSNDGAEPMEIARKMSLEQKLEIVDERKLALYV